MPVTGSNSFQPYDILSIRLGTDGFSFSISHSVNIHAVRHLQSEPVDETLSLTANFKRLVAEGRLPKVEAGRVEVTIVSPKYIVIPLELFDDEHAEELFYFSCIRHENESVQYQILPKSSVTVIFAVEKSLLACVREYYTEAVITTHVATEIDNLSTQNRQDKTRKMYARLHQSFVDIYVFQQGYLNFVNAFACTTANDCMYFLLNVWKQQGLDQFHDELEISGEMPHKTKLILELKQFVSQVIVS